MAEWKTVPSDQPLEEGKTYQNVWLIEVPSWLPESELAATLIGEGIGLQEEINSRLSSGNKVEITNKELQKQSDTEYHYVVTYKAIRVHDQDPMTAEALHPAIWALLAVLGIAGIAVTLHETRKLLKTDGGPAALFGMLALGFMALRSRNKDSGSS